MGLIVLLNSLVDSFDVCVWTLLTLVYPIYVSIRAIESNTNSHNRKFLIYWVLYALIMLFEVTSAKLIQWIPLWSYIKLIMACWLVLPCFDGAVYAYEYIVRPCISLEPQKLVHWFNIRREEFLLHRKDDFLLLAQRYIKENGSEALEKLIIEKAMCNCMGTSCRSKSYAVETANDVHEATAAAEMPTQTPNEGVTSIVPALSSGVVKNMKSMGNCMGTSRSKSNAVETVNEVHEATAAAAAAATATAMPTQTPNDVVTSVVPDLSSGVATDMKVKHMEPILTQTEHKTIQATPDVVELTAEAVGASKDGVLVPSESTQEHTKKGQKEWTCALCLVSTTNEAGLLNHIQGKRHKANVEKYIANNTTNKRRNNIALNINPHQKANQTIQMEHKNKANTPILPNPNYIKKQELVYEVVTTNGVGQGAKNMQKNPLPNHVQNEQLFCQPCSLQCNSISMLRDHLSGKKHLERCKIN